MSDGVVIRTTGVAREILVLVISTSVRMLNGILCATSGLEPAIAFRHVLVVVGTSLVHLSPSGDSSSGILQVSRSALDEVVDSIIRRCGVLTVVLKSAVNEELAKRRVVDLVFPVS